MIQARIIAEKRKELAKLEEQKNQLLSRRDELKQCCNADSPAQGVLSVRNNLLMVSREAERKVLGYEWSKVSVTGNDKESTITAACDVPFYSFKFSATREEKQVNQVRLLVDQNSALKEIESVLDVLSEENCPRLLLMTVQQFTHLHSFRKNLLNKTTSARRDCFEIHQPSFLGSEQESRYYLTLYVHQRGHSKVEIRWRIIWDESLQCLVHHISTPGIPTFSKETWHTKLLRITESPVPFTVDTETALEHQWCAMCSEICNI